MNVSIFPLKNALGALGLTGALCSTAHGQVPLKVGQAEVIRNEVVSVGDAELVRVSVGDCTRLAVFATNMVSRRNSVRSRLPRLRPS